MELVHHPFRRLPHFNVGWHENELVPVLSNSLSYPYNGVTRCSLAYALAQASCPLKRVSTKVCQGCLDLDFGVDRPAPLVFTLEFMDKHVGQPVQPLLGKPIGPPNRVSCLFKVFKLIVSTSIPSWGRT